MPQITRLPSAAAHGSSFQSYAFDPSLRGSRLETVGLQNDPVTPDFKTTRRALRNLFEQRESRGRWANEAKDTAAREALFEQMIEEAQEW